VALQVTHAEAPGPKDLQKAQSATEAADNAGPPAAANDNLSRLFGSAADRHPAVSAQVARPGKTSSINRTDIVGSL
jgi:hypothetical protein